MVSRRAGVAIVTLLVVLAVAGCGGGDEAEPDAADRTGSTDVAPSPTEAGPDGPGAEVPGEQDAGTAAQERSPVSIPAPTYSSFAGDLAMLDARERFPELGRQIEIEDMQRVLVGACETHIGAFAEGAEPAEAASRIVAGIDGAEVSRRVSPLARHAVTVYFRAKGCVATPSFDDAVVQILGGAG